MGSKKRAARIAAYRAGGGPVRASGTRTGKAAPIAPKAKSGAGRGIIGPKVIRGVSQLRSKVSNRGPSKRPVGPGKAGPKPGGRNVLRAKGPTVGTTGRSFSVKTKAEGTKAKVTRRAPPKVQAKSQVTQKSGGRRPPKDPGTRVVKAVNKGIGRATKGALKAVGRGIKRSLNPFSRGKPKGNKWLAQRTTGKGTKGYKNVTKAGPPRPKAQGSVKDKRGPGLRRSR